MKILFVTTTPNAIYEYLHKREDIDLSVVDCSSFIPQKMRKEDVSEVKISILKAIKEELAQRDPDILLTYRCPCILPADIFENTRIGAFNIHPSMLPKYPGANPWKEIYENQEKESGVTIHHIDEGIDTGEIVDQRTFRIHIDKDVRWHQKIVDELACEMLDSLLQM